MSPASEQQARASSTPRTGASGFTLVEVMVVVILIGLMAAMAAPRIHLGTFQLDAGVEEVGSALLGAQRQALEQQHNVVVAFDEAGERLRVHQDANNDLLVEEGERVSYMPLGEGVRIGRGSAPVLGVDGGEAVTFHLRQDGLPAVVFYRNGSASEEGTLYLTSPQGLTSAEYAGDGRAVRIERATGRPTWFRYGAGQWKRGF